MQREKIDRRRAGGTVKAFFEYLYFRVYEFFARRNDSLEGWFTFSFMTLFLVSFIVPIGLIVRWMARINGLLIQSDEGLVAVQISVLIIFPSLSFLLYRWTIAKDKYNKVYTRYHRDKYRLPIWVIFATPAFNVLITPVIYGLLTRSLVFMGHPVF